MELNKEGILKNLANNLKAKVEQREDKIVFIISALEKELSIDDIRFNKLLGNLSKYELIGNTGISHKHYFEQLISIQSSRPFFFPFAREDLKKEDSKNERNYEISPPSIECILMLMIVNPDYFKEHLSPFYRLRRIVDFEGDMKKPQKLDLESVLKKIFSRFLTLKIASKSPMNLEYFNTLFISFLFHINYNLDLPLIEVKSLEDKGKIRRLKHIRRQTFESLEIPKRKYKPELVYYYQQALSTDSPILEYLSYYQIIEYLFENVSEEDLINNVKLTLTSPDFSHKKPKSVKQLIKLIQGSALWHDSKKSI